MVSAATPAELSLAQVAAAKAEEIAVIWQLQLFILMTKLLSIFEINI